MSIKIFNAFEYTGTPDSLIKYFRNLKEEYIKQVCVKFCPLFVDTTLDRFKIMDMIELAIKKQVRAVNPTASACVYFHRKKIYVIFFGLEDYGANFIPDNVKGFVDMHYQNCTDKPDRIPMKEWRRRKRIWDKILGHGLMSEGGLSYNFADSMASWDIAGYVCNERKAREEIEDEVQM